MHRPVLSIAAAVVFAGAVAAPVVAQDQLVKQALQRIEKYEALAETLKPGDVATANKFIVDLAWAAKRLNASYDKKDPHYLDAAKRYQAVVAKIQGIAKAGAPTPADQPETPAVDTAKLAQLEREIGHATHNLSLLSVTHMGDSFRVASVRKEIASFKERLASFPTDAPQVAAVRSRLDAFAATFAEMHGRYTADMANSGDSKARMAVLKDKYRSERMPAELRHPFEPAEVRAWGERVRRLRDHEIPKDLEFIDSLKGAGGIDKQAQSSLRQWVGSHWPRRLAELEQTVGSGVMGGVVDAERNAKYVLETDPDNKAHVANRILGEGTMDETVLRLQANLKAVDAAAAWDLAFEDEGTGEARKAQRELVEKAIEHLQKVAEQALDQVRMPAAKTTDEQLRAVVDKVLAVESYGVGEVVRYVINTDKEHREMHSGDIDVGTVTTTVRVFHYSWDQFQVCTVEKEGDKYWLYYNTLKHYTSGGPTTPLNRWIMSGRFRSIQILKENIHKDPLPRKK